MRPNGGLARSAKQIEIGIDSMATPIEVHIGEFVVHKRATSRVAKAWQSSDIVRWYPYVITIIVALTVVARF